MANHPTAPVFEKVVGPIPTNCDALKAKWGIVTRKHRKGSQNSRKESHHILQDKAMKGLVSKYSGWAVLLNGGSGGEHDIANASQIARNCPAGSGGGAGPAIFGELLQAAQEDVEKALEGKVKDGETMSKAEAKKVAACLVAEAEQETQKARKASRKKPLRADSRVKPVKGCFPIGTLVWLNDVDLVPVDSLTEGMRIDAASQQYAIGRIDKCMGTLIEITFGGYRVSLAPHHRVRLSNQAFVRADRLLHNHVVDTAIGPITIEGVRTISNAQPLYGFSLQRRDACRIGASGLWVEVPQNDTPVIGHVSVLTHRSAGIV